MTAASNEVALLPCPMCGSDYIDRTGNEGPILPWASRKCLACGLAVTKKSNADADAAWNTRAHSDPRPVAEGLREALEVLLTAAYEYQESAREHISDTRYDEDGNLAERDAALAVVAIPDARAALATHSPAPLAGESWQGIATAPRDGTPFIATLVVHNLSGQKWWETHVIWADDETGEVASECEAGWSRVDDYSHWMPLPAPPAAAHPSTQEGGK